MGRNSVYIIVLVLYSIGGFAQQTYYYAQRPHILYPDVDITETELLTYYDTTKFKSYTWEHYHSYLLMTDTMYFDGKRNVQEQSIYSKKEKDALISRFKYYGDTVEVDHRLRGRRETYTAFINYHIGTETGHIPGYDYTGMNIRYDKKGRITDSIYYDNGRRVTAKEFYKSGQLKMLKTYGDSATVTSKFKRSGKIRDRKPTRDYTLLFIAIATIILGSLL